ncbi:MAG: helix-turn-helix transcriptional regulator [bacterium]|nr:helix-turn-helix transcriptional regulator [bacterium]
MDVNKGITSDYGERLRELRSLLEISQKDFAAKMGIAASFLSEVEKGKTKPGYNFLIKLAEIFNVNPSWVLLGYGEKFLGAGAGNNGSNWDFQDQSDEVRDLLIYFKKSPLVRLSVMAYASKFLLNNESIIKRDMDEHDSKKE